MKYYFSSINIFLDIIQKKGFPFIWKSNQDFFVFKNIFDKYLLLDVNSILNILPSTNVKDYIIFINELGKNSIIKNYFSRVFYNEYENIDHIPSNFNSGIIIGVSDNYLNTSYVNQFKCHSFDYIKLCDTISKYNTISDFINDFFKNIINDDSYFSQNDICLVQYTDKDGYIESFFVNGQHIKYNWNFCGYSDGLLRKYHCLSSLIIFNNPKITKSDLTDILSFYDIYFDNSLIDINP